MSFLQAARHTVAYPFLGLLFQWFRNRTNGKAMVQLMQDNLGIVRRYADRHIHILIFFNSKLDSLQIYAHFQQVVQSQFVFGLSLPCKQSPYSCLNVTNFQ